MGSFPTNKADHEVNEICPYSDPPFVKFTDDHIFPEFLGGRRSIRVCRECNSLFGHGFEAKTARQLRRMQVFISHFGLDLTRNPAMWPSALEIDGATYSLKSGPEGVQYQLAHPVILRDEAGHIVGGRARSRAEAQQFAASLVKKGKAKEVIFEEEPGEHLNDIKLCVDLSYNDDLYRFSAKLVGNMTIFMGRKALIQQSGMGAYLNGGPGQGVRIALCDTSAIRALRPGLSHTVYVEFGRLQSQAVVILFGALQMYVPLPSAEPGAVLGFLDPITGEESFREVKALNILPAARASEADAPLLFDYMNKRLADESIARGAKASPDLSVCSYDFGRPSES